MAKYVLDDVCEFITDGTHQTPTYCEESGVLFLSSKDVTSRKIDWKNAKHIPNDLHEALYKRLAPRRNDILLAKNGTTGVAAIVDRDDIFDVYVSLAVLRPKKEIYPQYLLYAINSPVAKRQFNAGLKGIGVPNLHLSVIRKTEINVCNYEKQVEICGVLDKVSAVIEARQRELQKLDELVKARFVEMFGDPIRNTQSRPTTEVINVVKMQRGFDLPVQDRQQNGNVPVLGSNGALDHHNVSKVTGGGVITGRSGTIGKVFYTEGDYWPLNTSLFSVDTHGNNVIYLAKLLELYDLSRFVEGTGVPTLNRNMFHNKQIIDVSIEEQNEFAFFVKQVDKSKVVVQKALDKAQLLFDSLMQEYFG